MIGTLFDTGYHVPDDDDLESRLFAGDESDDEEEEEQIESEESLATSPGKRKKITKAGQNKKSKLDDSDDDGGYLHVFHFNLYSGSSKNDCTEISYLHGKSVYYPSSTIIKHTYLGSYVSRTPCGARRRQAAALRWTSIQQHNSEVLISLPHYKSEKREYRIRTIVLRRAGL